MIKLIAHSVALAGSFIIASVSIAAADPMSGECATIAAAKFLEWKQPRMMVVRAKTFDDGRVSKDELIVTENTAYKRDGTLWTSAGITVRERAVASPERILKDMRLASCTKSSSGYENGEPVSVYTYAYLPDEAGYSAHGTIWISDATGLPVREAFVEPAPPANARIAKAIEATYRYNGDVAVPTAAELAEARRLTNNQAVVRNMQSGGGGLGGPQQ